jgi:hypothetical protein
MRYWTLRLATVGLISLGVLAVSVATARADDELDDYLSRAADADYQGTAVVVSSWHGVRAATVVDIAKSGSTLVVDSGAGAVTITGDGSAHDAGGTVRMSEWSSAGTSDRYRVAEGRPVVVIGRPAVELEITEGDVTRAVMVVDEETGATLSTTVFGADGVVFRESAYTSFDGAGAGIGNGDAGPGYTMLLRTPDSELPHDLAGYLLVDAYRDASGVSQAYFSDGLFSFSVFELDESDRLAGADGDVELDVDGSTYRVVVEPTRLSVTWRAESGDFLLVGDLPPDHLEDVLGELPAPGSDGLLRRVWQSLFG